MASIKFVNNCGAFLTNEAGNELESSRLNKSFDVPTLAQLPKQQKLKLVMVLWETTENLIVDWKDAIHSAIYWYGPDPYFKFLLATHYQRVANRRAHRLAQKAKHIQNQILWFSGGRLQKYLENHGRFGGHHDWLATKLEKRTGMIVGDVEGPERLQYRLPRVKACRKPARKQRKSCAQCGSTDCPLQFCSYLDCPPATKPTVVEEKKRSIMLLYKLKAIIRSLRADPTYWETVSMERGLAGNVLPKENKVVEAHHQTGETTPDEHGAGEVSLVQTSNVIVTEQHGGNVAGELPTPSAVRMISSDIIDSYSSQVGRNYLFKTFQWKTTETFDTEVLSATLPKDFVVAIDGTPNHMPFTVNRYFRGDMEIRFQVNSNIFMTGQLMACWWYNSEQDARFKFRNNVACASQTLHTLVSATASNEAVLVIPYRNFKPVMEVGHRSDKSTALNLGYLSVKVLNPLMASSTTQNECTVSVFISFKNSEFTGYVRSANNKPDKPEVSATHQMEAAAVVAGMTLANKFIDANRDKPTTSANPSYFSPQPAQSWCIGTKEAEDLFALRLEQAQVPHPPTFADAEFTTTSICQRFGLVKANQTWNATDTTGTKLFSLPAVPMLPQSEYCFIKDTTTNNDLLILPPVSYMSNLFQYWRGSLLLRLDFIASMMFQTGRLLIAYVPGDYQSDLTFEDVKSSPHAFFDLKETQQLVFRIPYVADKLYWPRIPDAQRIGSDEFSPGYVYCFVVGKLVGTDVVPSSVRYNMYLAAGEDFELVVPAQPTIGLSFINTIVIPDKDKMYAKSGYFPYYIGCYAPLSINNKDYSTGQSFAILRYGPGPLHAAQFVPPNKPDWGKNKAYYYKTTVTDVKLRLNEDRSLVTPVAFFLPWYDGEYVYLLPCRSEAVAKDWCKNMIANSGDPQKFLSTDHRPDIYFYPYWDDDKDDYWGGKNEAYEQLEYTPARDDFEIVNAVHQIDNRVDVEAPILSPAGPSVSLGRGMYQFGEDFGDLKNLVRRYQPYSLVYLKKEKLVLKPGNGLFKFPVLPQGLDLVVGTKTQINHFGNRARDGHIPLLLAGYRYFRGSVRFRVIVPNINVTYFIQHKPYVPLTTRKVTIIGSDELALDNLLNHSYAYTVQSQRINNILSFEVPFYLPYDSMCLQQNKIWENSKHMHLQDVHYASSLGEIIIGVLNCDDKLADIKTGITFDIAYSLGDDARPAVFQGFPPIIMTREVPYVAASHQMWSNLKEKLTPSPIASLSETLSEIRDLDLVNVNENFQKFLAESTDKLKMVDKMSDAASHVKARATDAFEAFMRQLKESNAPQIIINAASNLMHVVVSPTVPHMTIAFSAFLFNLGVVGIHNMTAVQELCSRIFGSAQEKRLPEGEASAKHQLEEGDAVALASLLYAGIGTALSVKHTQSSKFSKGIALDLMTGLDSGCKSGSYFFRFVQNVMGVLMKIFNYLKKKCCPEVLGLEKLGDDEAIVRRWSEEAIFLTDVSNERFFDCVPGLVDRVQACYIVGSLIHVRLATAARGVNISVLRDLYHKIVTLKTELADKGLAASIRREPFIVCIYGAPGIGKSQMAHKNIINMLRSAKIEISGNPIYTHPAGAKYWENVNQEPAMLMDDVLILKSGETFDSEVASIMSIKSSALFTPPIAECARKKKRYAPEIVYQHINTLFPELNSSQCPEAVYRRRDMLWECALVDSKRTVKDFSAEELDNCDHLVFRLHRDPSDKNLMEPWGTWMNYESFMRLTNVTFNRFRNKQIENFGKKIDYLAAAVQECTRFPELSVMPLADILKNYSNDKYFTNLELYKTEPLVQATHQIMLPTEIHEIISGIIDDVKDNPDQCKALTNFLVTQQLARKGFVKMVLTGEIVQGNSSAYKEMYEIFKEVIDIEEFQGFLVEAEYVADNQLTSLISGVHKLSKVYDALPKLSKPKQTIRQTKNLIDNVKSVVETEPEVPLTKEAKEKLLKELKTAENRQEQEELDRDPLLLECSEADLRKWYVERKPTRICDRHTSLLFKKYEGDEINLGKEFFGLPKIFETSEALKLAIETRLTTESKPLCRHLFTVLRKDFVKTETKCCITTATTQSEVPHWCAFEAVPGCGLSCVAYEGIPLLDDNCCTAKLCIFNSPSSMTTWRALQATEKPTWVDAKKSGDSSNCSKFFLCSRLRLKMISIRAKITTFFGWIKEKACAIWNKFMGFLRPVYDFLKKYKVWIVSALGLIGATFTFAYRKEIGSCVKDKWERKGEIFINAKDSVVSTGKSIGGRCKSIFSSAKNDVDIGATSSTVEPELEELLATHEIIASSDPRMDNRAVRSVFKAKTLADAKAINPRIVHQTQHDDVIAKRICENTLTLVGYSVKPDGSIDEAVTPRTVRALALGDRYVLTVLHGYEVLKYFKLTRIRTFIKDRLCEVDLEHVDSTPLVDSSLIVLKFPRTFPQFKRIVQYFASEADHAYRAPSRGEFVMMDKNINSFTCNIKLSERIINIDGMTGASPVRLTEAYEYGFSKSGACGSLLLGDSMGAPIIGMHVAGSNEANIGYAEPLFRETYAPLFEGLITDIAEPTFLPIDDSNIDLDTTVFPTGSVGKFKHYSPSETMIHQSSLFNYRPPCTAPAPLSSKDPRLPAGSSPLISGVRKHGILTKSFPREVLARTRERLFTHLVTNCHPSRAVRPLILTDSQSVCGDPDLAFCDPLRWNSSEGYPYYKFRPGGASDKKWLFALEDTPRGLRFNGFNSLLGPMLLFKRRQRNDGVPQATIFTDCLKDARIPISKVSTPGKTRIFSMSPVDYTIDFRKYFYDFISSYQTQRLNNYNAIGINVFSSEWDLLARKLRVHPNICTGDYSNFGPGLNEEVAALCLEIILDWYDHFCPDDSLEIRRTRACLAYELIGSYHLCSDLVYKVVAGIPSGSPITVVLNSLVNTFYLFAAWDMLSQEWDPLDRNFQLFLTHVVLFTYGDDFIMSVSDYFKDRFNTKIIAELFAKFDIKVTDAFKGEEVTPYSSLEKSSFLKGSFNYFMGRYWYGLDKDQIFDMVNWVKTKHGIEAATIENADMALLHAQGHGTDFFNAFKSQITKAFINKQILFHGRTFAEITDLKLGKKNDPEYNELLKRVLLKLV